jgi:hypothetical protein
MVQKWEITYEEMVHHIDECHHKNIPEQEQAGHAYKIALQCWQQIKAEMKSYEFINEQEEIDFYKGVKPKFTGYIEYLMLVNNGLIFIPTESKDAEQNYWQFEVERFARFKHRNKAFVEYYESGRCDNDGRYFLPSEEDFVYKFSKIYNLDGYFVTSHDHLVASLFAEERYHEFAKKKLNEALEID